MMKSAYTDPVIPIGEFSASKQLSLFDNLKQLRFSGQLILQKPRRQGWIFYLYMGRIVYATGGVHPVRRWQRNLAIYAPQIDASQLSSLSKLLSADPKAFQVCWEYQLLCLWVEQQLITREQAAKMIRAIAIEVLFDVTQAMKVTFQVEEETVLSTQLVLLDAEQLIRETEQIWQTWQTAKVADRSPHQSPAIRQPGQLQQQTSASVYRVLSTLIDGQRTLYDIALQLNRSTVDVTSSLLPYIQAGFVELRNVPDLPTPIALPATPPRISTVPRGPVVACVDDSPLVCRKMEKILTDAGYQFLGVQDSLRAIAALLIRKPELIFLDLVMPDANGYEICAQLRKLSLFRDTPIIILTGNDSVVDRVRAKVVGATEFISKPVEVETVLAITRKYLLKDS